MKPSQIRDFIREDAPEGDITTRAVFGSAKSRVRAEIVAKETLVVSGFKTVSEVLRDGFQGIRLKIVYGDGVSVKKGDVLARLAGPVREMLIAERLILNFLQQMSGVATLTSKFVARVKGRGIQILDTRKTTPGLRVEEKRAVRDGGGGNHRMSLSDQYLIKDNHIAAAGSVSLALQKVRAHRHKSRRKRRIEVEVKNISEFKETLVYRPDIVLLDNMTPAAIRRVVKLRNEFVSKQRLQLEISGGVTLENLKRFAGLGVERISVGALTHSARAVDISMRFV